jgi:hypothetical protein
MGDEDSAGATADAFISLAAAGTKRDRRKYFQKWPLITF